MDNDQFTFSEEDAVKYIRAKLSNDSNNKYDDEDILCIIDIIWDYYERKGMLTLNIDDDTEDDQLDPDDLVKYVKKEVKNDGELEIDSKDVEIIVKAELDYEESLESFI